MALEFANIGELSGRPHAFQLHENGYISFINIKGDIFDSWSPNPKQQSENSQVVAQLLMRDARDLENRLYEIMHLRRQSASYLGGEAEELIAFGGERYDQWMDTTRLRRPKLPVTAPALELVKKLCQVQLLSIDKTRLFAFYIFGEAIAVSVLA